MWDMIVRDTAVRDMIAEEQNVTDHQHRDTPLPAPVWKCASESVESIAGLGAGVVAGESSLQPATAKSGRKKPRRVVEALSAFLAYRAKAAGAWGSGGPCKGRKIKIPSR